ncbi:MAG: histidine triad nucleotide-binding protein [Oscillospiraceae bacterium]|nr:histidine triad nucleotide-binding protein [Oscillospiraceae bacterium]
MTDCIFCKIVRGEIPADKVYEDEYILIFRDIQPAAPTHLLCIPKAHIASAAEIDDGNVDLVGRVFVQLAVVAKDLGLGRGFRIVTNCGEDGGQTVGHLHFHLLGGRQLIWPPG